MARVRYMFVAYVRFQNIIVEVNAAERFELQKTFMSLKICNL